VSTARQGQSIEYSLTDPRIIDALDILRAVLRDGLAHRAQLVSE
jgi:DNA-binding transcriptional ArsR family regulator